jgi:hypothetical protein
MLLEEPSAELIWQDLGSYHLEKETLLFSLFYVNPMKTDVEIEEEMGKIFKDLQIRLEPWIKHYVWDSTPVSIELINDKAKGYCYVYGQLAFGDTFDDQWLVTSILFEFTKSYPDLYIHLSDNDGEFLLIEAYEHLPEWLTPEDSSNRSWMNHGRIIIIPEEYYNNRGLKLTEALGFLERAVYKCSQVLEIDDVIRKRLSDYPNKALENQCELELRVPRNCAGLLIHYQNKMLLNQAVFAYGKSSLASSEVNDGNLGVEVDHDYVDLKIRSTVMCYLFINFYLKNAGKHENFKTNADHLVHRSLRSFAEENKLRLDVFPVPTDEEINRFNEQGDVLQKELMRLMRIEQFVEPKFEFDEPSNATVDPYAEDELTSKLKQFFEDTEAGLEGVNNNQPRKSAEEQDRDGDDVETDDEDEKAREFLKQQNVDIDEDDFFEFFSKEALRLTDEDMEKFRNLQVNDPQEPDAGHHDDGYQDYDSEEERELMDNLASNDLESIQELLKMLKHGGNEGPGSTFLQNLDNLQ